MLLFAVGLVITYAILTFKEDFEIVKAIQIVLTFICFLCIVIIIILNFVTLARFLEVEEYRRDAGRALIPMLVLSVIILVAICVSLVVVALSIDPTVLLYNELCRNILMFFLNVKLAIMVPLIVVDLNFKTVYLSNNQN